MTVVNIGDGCLWRVSGAFLAQQAPGASAQTNHGVSVLDLITAGGVVGYFIVLLSVAALALIIMHAMQIRAAAMAPPEHLAALRELLAQRDADGALAWCTNTEKPSFFSRIVEAGLSRCKRSAFGYLELRSALEEAGQEQVAKLYRSTDGLGLIAGIAPMLGLLGTVVGMVGAFDTISASEGFARPDQMAGDISKALVTTLMGITLAIPATAAFTFFRNRIDAISTDIAGQIEELASTLESEDPAAESRSVTAGAQVGKGAAASRSVASTGARLAEPAAGAGGSAA